MSDEPISLTQAIQERDELKHLTFKATCIERRTDVDANDEWHNPKNKYHRPFNYEIEITAPSGRGLKFAYSKGYGHHKPLVKLLEGKKTNFMTVSYEYKVERSRRLGHVKCKPNEAEMLYGILMDVREFVFDMPTFEEWAENFGWDSDSRKAEKIYRHCLDQYYNAQRVFGMPTLQYLCDTELVDLEEWD